MTTITVGELIDRLKRYPSTYKVLISYEDTGDINHQLFDYYKLLVQEDDYFPHLTRE